MGRYPEKHGVLPLADSPLSRLASAGVLPEYPPRPGVVLYPDGGPVSDEALPLLVGGGEIVAEVEVIGVAQGVLFALGDSNGGLALYAVGAQLSAAVVLPGAAVNVTAGQPILPGRHNLGCRLKPAGRSGSVVEVLVDGTVLGSATVDGGLPVAWQHGGTRLTLGYARGLPVTDDYVPPFSWNGTLRTVRVQGSAGRPSSLEETQTSLRVD